MSTIREIAERTKLSVGTVSIVLNGRGDEMRISKKLNNEFWKLLRDSVICLIFLQGGLDNRMLGTYHQLLFFGRLTFLRIC